MIAFAPQEATSYFEPIDLVYGEDSFLRLTFTGVGVDCDIHLEGVEEGGVDFGHTLSGDVATRTLKVECVHVCVQSRSSFRSYMW